jgi:hypothetical protein
MINNIFVNLPVKDLEKSKASFGAIGCTINKQFTDEMAASIVIGDRIFTMLLTHDKYRQFSSKQIIDANKASEVLIALGVDSKGEVNRIADAAVKAGGRASRPAQD